MAEIDEASTSQSLAVRVHPWLVHGEHLLWSGHRGAGPDLSWRNLPIVLLLLAWSVGATVVVGNAILHGLHGDYTGAGPASLFALWGAGLVALGIAPWAAATRIAYAVTDRRALILNRVWGRSVRSVFVESAPGVRFKRSKSTASIYFTPRDPGLQIVNFESGPAFKRVSDPDLALHLVQRLREGQHRNIIQTSLGIAPTEADTRLAPCLEIGEVVLWIGHPDRRIVFHARDIFLVPFSLVWGYPGTYVFVTWLLGVLGMAPRSPYPFFAFPFTVIALYLLFGRFIYAWLNKTFTTYAITDRRAIQVSGFLGTKMLRRGRTDMRFAAMWLITLNQGPFGRRGSVLLTDPNYQAMNWHRRKADRTPAGPAFADIENPEAPYALLVQLRIRAQTEKGL